MFTLRNFLLSAAITVGLSFTVLVHAQEKSGSVLQQLEKWLAVPADQRKPIEKLALCETGLNKIEAEKVTRLLWNDYENAMRLSRKKEWEDKLIELGDLKMKFEFKTFGEKPDSGRSLFISMHGGGGAPAHVNESQWRNQIRLYKPDEGVYLAPRAPTDTWNLWHQSHIDKFFERIIQDAVLFEDVNPNRVYIMGYSAGGDGVYQLAPRMADSLAAAAMMAGHPNDASPLGLRNIGFALYMGGKDAAYNRNGKAEEWKERLAELKKDDPDGYQHDVVIYPQHSHWMKGEDAAAVPWMAKFSRDPLPKKIVWRQASTTHPQFYWLAVGPGEQHNGQEIVASRSGNSIRIERVSGPTKKVEVLLNDKMLDLDKEVKIVNGDKPVFEGKVQRTIGNIYQSILGRGDRELIFAAKIEVSIEN